MPVVQLNAWSSNAVTVKPIPAIQNQVGPTCGLTALSIVMKYWYDLLVARYAALPMQQPGSPLPATRGVNDPSMRERLMAEVRGAGGTPKPLVKGTLPTFLPTMQDIAERMGSRIGEVAQATTLARIAREAGGFEAKVESWDGSTTSMIELIRKKIDANIPPIIAYDNTDTGDPGTGNHGDRAHWAVILGYVNNNGLHELIATHGWGNYYVWSAEKLRESNEQLERYQAKEGTWVNVVTAGKPAWNQRNKTSGYDLAATHRATSWVQGKAGWEQRPVQGAVSVRSFAPVDSAQDLKRQLVIVTPVGESDFRSTGSVATAASVATGRGDTY